MDLTSRLAEPLSARGPEAASWLEPDGVRCPKSFSRALTLEVLGALARPPCRQRHTNSSGGGECDFLTRLDEPSRKRPHGNPRAACAKNLS